MYHDYEHKQHATFAEIKDNVQIGESFWTGREWMKRHSIAFVSIHPADYDANMRLCHWCQRPLIWCRCNPLVDRRQVAQMCKDSIQYMLDSIQALREEAALRDYDAMLDDFQFAARWF